jgi:N6-adenosine-specific RNA methylase IME4
MNIKIDLNLKALIPPLSEDEKSLLEQSILDTGCRDPLVVWDGLLIDGHNRYDICTRHGLPFNTTDIHFDGIEQARVWMRKNQMGRRNLTTAWRIELELANKEDLAAIGRSRMSDAGEQGGRGNKKGLSQNDNPFAEEPKHNTQAEIAKAAGTSTGMVGMAEQVRKKSPELWEKAKRDEVTVSAAYKEIKKEEKKQERQELIQRQRDDIEQGNVKLPSGVFEVVAMDPPWNYGREYDPETSRVANPYPEMTQQELLALDPPFADDCVLFLWTTHQFIWDAKALMDRWGFTYKATAVWDKERIGMGAWLRMQCEFVLVGVKGKPTWSNTTWRDIIREPRREHSRKPDAFYDMVADITVGRRLEYFSRERREGWEVLGNDVEKF